MDVFFAMIYVGSWMDVVTNIELSSSFIIFVLDNCVSWKDLFGTRNFYTKDVSAILTLDPLGKMIQFHEYVFQTGASTTAKRNLKVH